MRPYIQVLLAEFMQKHACKLGLNWGLYCARLNPQVMRV